MDVGLYRTMTLMVFARARQANKARLSRSLQGLFAIGGPHFGTSVFTSRFIDEVCRRRHDRPTVTPEPQGKDFAIAPSSKTN